MTLRMGTVGSDDFSPNGCHRGLCPRTAPFRDRTAPGGGRPGHGGRDGASRSDGGSAVQGATGLPNRRYENRRGCGGGAPATACPDGATGSLSGGRVRPPRTRTPSPDGERRSRRDEANGGNRGIPENGQTFSAPAGHATGVGEPVGISPQTAGRESDDGDGEPAPGVRWKPCVAWTLGEAGRQRSRTQPVRRRGRCTRSSCGRRSRRRVSVCRPPRPPEERGTSPPLRPGLRQRRHRRQPPGGRPAQPCAGPNAPTEPPRRRQTRRRPAPQQASDDERPWRREGRCNSECKACVSAATNWVPAALRPVDGGRSGRLPAGGADLLVSPRFRSARSGQPHRSSRRRGPRGPRGPTPRCVIAQRAGEPCPYALRRSCGRSTCRAHNR